MFTIILPINAIEEKEFTILFTHDLHDNLESFEVLKDDKVETRGGFARLATVIDKERKKDPNALLVDAGDFSKGTLYQTIFSSESPALRLMGDMAYDVTTLGNHEFDFFTEGLNDSLQSALQSGDPLPSIIASNTQFLDNESEDIKELQNTFKDLDIKDYLILNKNDIKVAVIGLMGEKAADTVISEDIEFSNMVKTTKNIIKEIKTKEEPDLILVLSHAGTSGKKGKTEDEMLARKVPEIDVIISGHSHTILSEPILVGNTIIASAGRYGENLGTMKLKKNGDQWDLEDYKLKSITEDYKEDKDIKRRVEHFKSLVNEAYLAQYNLEFNQVIAYSPFNFINSKEIGKKHQEEPLGLLIADAYKYAVEQAEGKDYKNVDLAMVTPGIIRDSFVEGIIEVKDIYKVSSLGMGEDGRSGYPLIDLYLTGKELKALTEIDASNQNIPDVSQIYMSNLKYTYNPNRIAFDKVTHTKIIKNDTEEDLVDDQIYRVVTNLHSAETLGIAEKPWGRTFSIKPKDVNEREIESLEEQIIYKDGEEIKEWIALTEYLKSFPEKNRLAEIPEKYSKKQGFKEKVDDKGILARIENPNATSLIVILTPLFLFIIFITIVIKYIKRYKN